LTYQEQPFGPQIASSAVDITTMAVGTVPTAPQIPFFLFQNNALPGGLDTLLAYLGLSDAGKDAFVEGLLNGAMTPFRYDPIGLSSDQATLLAGSYFVGHSYGWSDFNIDGTNGDLMVTTYGVPAYTSDQLASDPNIPNLTPTIVSQFSMTPSSDNILGTPQ